MKKTILTSMIGQIYCGLHKKSISKVIETFEFVKKGNVELINIETGEPFATEHLKHENLSRTKVLMALRRLSLIS